MQPVQLILDVHVVQILGHIKQYGTPPSYMPALQGQVLVTEFLILNVLHVEHCELEPPVQLKHE